MGRKVECCADRHKLIAQHIFAGVLIREASAPSPKSLEFRRGPEGGVENGSAAFRRSPDQSRIDLDMLLEFQSGLDRLADDPF